MKQPGGYTLIETLLAAVVLLFGIVAAASLANTMIANEESNAHIARALNYQEQAARLFQLGLDQTTITNLIPLDSTVKTLTFTVTTTNLANIGSVDRAQCEMVFTAGPALTAADQTTSALRTNDLVLVRPSIR